MLYKEYHPPHLYFDETIYFLATRTVNREKFWTTPRQKRLFLSCLKMGLRKFKIPIFSWVIPDNHYHLLIQIKKGRDLFRFVNFLNGRSAFELNKLENKKGRKIWYQYWDHCIRDEADFWRHFNYIHHNPIKHGLVKTQDECGKYPFCSYGQWVLKEGREWADSCFYDYPIADFTSGDD